MANVFKKIGDYIHAHIHDLDKVHVRAAFVDVEHRIEKLFHTHGEHFEKDKESNEKTEE